MITQEEKRISQQHNVSNNDYGPETDGDAAETTKQSDETAGLYITKI